MSLVHKQLLCFLYEYQQFQYTVIKHGTFNLIFSIQSLKIQFISAQEEFVWEGVCVR